MPNAFINGPCSKVPTMPPMLKAATAVMPAETGIPASLSRLGSQLKMKYRINRFMKNGIQSSTVPPARPSVKRCLTGKPSRRSESGGGASDTSAASGAMRRTIADIRSRSPPMTARKRSDSGSALRSTIASAIGSRPPTTNTDRHPQIGMSAPPTMLATTAPPAMPTKIADTNSGCNRLGAYSDASETAFGIAPPRPSPVRKRSRTSSSSERARAVSSDNAPKTSTETMMADLRPQRSATGPDAIAPIIRPKSPADSAGPNAARGTPNSAAIDGTRKPIACVSNPSNKMTKAQSTIAVI